MKVRHRQHMPEEEKNDYIFCDADLKDSVKKSGSLGLHKGLISDHTMQWADFGMNELFGGQLYNPALLSERQFTIDNVKKEELQSKLLDLLEKEKYLRK